MKLCIPTVNYEAVKISKHFGSAPYFFIYDTATGTSEVIANSNQHHEHNMCNPIEAIRGKDVNAVICFGIGEGAIRNLKRNNIAVYRTDKNLIDEILQDSKENKFLSFEDGHACQAHDKHHTHTCSH